MRKKLESLDKKLPGAKDALGESLKQAGQAMKKAQGELGKQAPGKARPQQDQALEKLSETMNELQSRLKQAESNENDNGVGVNDPHRKVAIPEEDSYGVPRAFRAEILKVMKERAPERFDKAIERYYQELVK